MITRIIFTSDLLSLLYITNIFLSMQSSGDTKVQMAEKNSERFSESLAAIVSFSDIKTYYGAAKNACAPQRGFGFLQMFLSRRPWRAPAKSTKGRRRHGRKRRNIACARCRAIKSKPDPRRVTRNSQLAGQRKGEIEKERSLLQPVVNMRSLSCTCMCLYVPVLFLGTYSSSLARALTGLRYSRILIRYTLSAVQDELAQLIVSLDIRNEIRVCVAICLYYISPRETKRMKTADAPRLMYFNDRPR